MYTNIPSVQILISLLKQFDIHHIVISPGTRNTALAHSIEEDEFFKCYSVVDERSAGYLALGISEALDKPVCVTCTAATATCNYMPAIKEAFERNIQLVALTADQNAYSMFHMEDQCIDQVDMYHGYVKCAVDVPKVIDEHDYWYCNRRINEALLELNHHGKGPVQINYHMDYSLEELAIFPVNELPKTRKITRVDNISDFSGYADQLSKYKRILVLCGSCNDKELRLELKRFNELYNSVVVYDTFSNVADNDFILPKTLGDVLNWDCKQMIEPDLIITVGNIFYSTIKYNLVNPSCENWNISEDGMVNDGFHCLSTIFECGSESDFFKEVNKSVVYQNDNIYKNNWKKLMDKIQIGDIPFTNLKVIEKFCSMIPDGSILHTSVLDSIRMSNYVRMNCKTECYANIGADGIDGALSASLGQASKEDKLSFLLVGDLSLMYDMNALLSDLPPNVRILVINNYAGAEFHKNFGVEKIPTLDRHIAAGHTTRMQQCAQLANLEYLSAENEEKLEEALNRFILSDGKAKMLEVFTDAKMDADTLKKYWKQNAENMPISKKTAQKRRVKKIIGEKNIKIIKKIVRR